MVFIKNSQITNLIFKSEMFILQITIPGAARSWEEQLKGLRAGRQNTVLTKSNTIRCLCKMLINPNLMLKKKEQIKLTKSEGPC